MRSLALVHFSSNFSINITRNNYSCKFIWTTRTEGQKEKLNYEGPSPDKLEQRQ